MKLLTYLILPCILFSNGALAAQKTGKPVASKPSSITGQVFVVTRTRESIKLALVEVLAIPEQEFLQQIEAPKKLKLDVESAAALAKQEYDQADNDFNVAEENLRLAQEGVFKVYEKEHGSIYDHSFWGYGQIKDDYLKQRDIALVRPIAILASSKVSRSEKSNSLLAAEALVPPFITGQYYFASLPKGFASKTDADGKFLLDLPAGKYVVAAKSSRLVSLYSQEDYYWLIYVNTTSKNQSLMLSNDNLFKTQCNECVQP
jgi:hypothetical protein